MWQYIVMTYVLKVVLRFGLDQKFKIVVTKKKSADTPPPPPPPPQPPPGDLSFNLIRSTLLSSKGSKEC